MEEYYSKIPVVKAVVYNDLTVKEIIEEFWRRGFFVRIRENTDLMLVTEMSDTVATEIMPGQYVVFHTENQYGISFDVIGWDEFRQKYALYTHKATTTEDISKENN